MIRQRPVALTGARARHPHGKRRSLTSSSPRPGDFSETDEGTFLWVVEFLGQGEPYPGTLSMKLDGDLISRLFWPEPAEPIGFTVVFPAACRGVVSAS